MDTWEKLKFASAIAGVGALLLALRSISGQVFPQTTHLAHPGYKVSDVTEPAVDLASLQRRWPAGLSEEGGRANVHDYMSNIEKVSIPRSAEGPPALAAPAPQVDLATALATADVGKGRETAQVCTSCHSFDPGGADRIGPGLWGIVGRQVASHGTFAYSSAFKAQTGVWSYERLDHYLTSPAKAVPGNRMGFAGFRRAEDRANVLAFLSTLSAKPVPFPKAESPKIVANAPRLGAK